MNGHKPEIMAPAGDRASFLAALAAGADAVYAGLKHFSARMQAANFGVSELAGLAALARDKGACTYVAMNALMKPGDEAAAGRLIDRLTRQVRPEGLIVQDLGLARLARQAGFRGELHLSTLAALSHPAGLAVAKGLGFSRVVLPRELDLDEIKAMAAACPQGLDLEVFVHGALCHCVSGRCWWSSWLGGKSGLRGRCVQPCRRLYREGGPKGKSARLFSCLDLSLDVLVRTLLSVPRVRAWKIEGRKKGPHYVFYTTRAYRLLRDEGDDPQAKKVAMDLLGQALGRTGTHSVFLPQKPHSPVRPDQDTGSGLVVGSVKRAPGPQPKAEAFFQARCELLPGDVLRIGCEDEPWHTTLALRQRLPKGGRFTLRPQQGKAARSGTLVFLVDRREPELATLLANLERELAARTPGRSVASEFAPAAPPPAPPAAKKELTLYRIPAKGKLRGEIAHWLERRTFLGLPPRAVAKTWWWLPPVIWPGEEDKYRTLVAEALRKGARRFVLNAPWQIGLFADPGKAWLCAGPFCNLANVQALAELKDLGFTGAIVSPELSREDFLALPGHSPLPLGVVTQGLWPCGISRIKAEGLRFEEPLRSPKNEICFVRRIGGNYWIFPGWELDISDHVPELSAAGYSLFVSIKEPWPKAVPRMDRPGTFNWDLALL